MIAPVNAVPAFMAALKAGRMTRHAFERWQARRLNHWLNHDLPKVGFYSGASPDLSSLPIINKETVMARFEDFNTGRITAEQGWAAFETTGETNGVAIGASTGTSGNRTLYAVTPAERFRWLGAILAKTAPRFLLRPERVAVVLPQSSALYDEANKAGRLKLAFFDLRDGPEDWLTDLVDFAPTTIIAPPRVLRHLAETAPGLAPRQIFAGGETLDPVDRAVIQAQFGIMLGQIYMATEGLFGVTCPHGRLHLAEDTTFFEFEPVGDGLVAPLVTGFRRSFQVMARYRMNDLLRLSDQHCPCGSPLRVVDEVVGRTDDVFWFGDVMVTPDILRNAVLDASRAINDFRLLKDGQDKVSLILKPDLPDDAAKAARAGLTETFKRRGLDVDVSIRREPLDLLGAKKLRRIENRWRQGL